VEEREPCNQTLQDRFSSLPANLEIREVESGLGGGIPYKVLYEEAMFQGPSPSLFLYHFDRQGAHSIYL